MVRPSAPAPQRAEARLATSPTVGAQPLTSPEVGAPPSASPQRIARVVAGQTVAEPQTAEPETTEATTGDPSTTNEADVPWVVLVWNDPINLMSYVVYVFQTLFGYSETKATELMLDVHHKGRAAVAWGPREKAELDVFRLHEFGLWATMQKDN